MVGYNPMRWRRFWVFIFGLLLLNIIVSSIIQSASQPASVTIPYNLFLDEVNGGNVVNITATGDSITGTTKTAVSAGSGQPSAKNFLTQRPSFASDNLEATLLKNKVSILAEPPNPPTPFWETLLLWFGPTLLIVFGFIYLMRRSAAALGGGAPAASSDGSARAARDCTTPSDPTPRSPTLRGSTRSRRSSSRSSTF